MFEATFDIHQRTPIEADMSPKKRKATEATFEIAVVPKKHNNLNGRDEADCHPIGAVTDLQNNLDTLSNGITAEEEARQEADGVLQEQIDVIAVKSNGYIHEQGVASAEWTVQHNLDKYPSVTVVDSAENEIVADIEYLDKNTVRITMTGASKGRAYFN